MSSQISVHHLGRADYSETLELQQRLQRARQRGAISDTLLLLEHPPVLTLGRSAKRENVLLDPSALQALGMAVHETGRGGDVTYHGPGQVVAYVIVDLNAEQDVRKYVGRLEEVMIRVSADYGLEARRIEKLNGTWIGDRKIGAVGVRISRWVTMHGFALNVNTDLSHFQTIIPCGLVDKGVTSLAEELGRPVEVAEVHERIRAHVAAVFDAQLHTMTDPPLSGVDPAAWGPEPWERP